MENSTYPYYPSLYTENNNDVQNRQRENDQRNSLLLVTEPRDLDQLFNTNRTSRKPEQDICFPPNKNGRPSTSSTAFEKDEADELDIKSYHRMNTRHSSSSSLDGINISALTLFSEFVSPDQSPLPKHYYNTPGEEKSKLLSLYGDNNGRSSIHQRDLSEKSYNSTQPPSEDRFMYYHVDTGCVRGRSLSELKLPPNMTLEQLLLKDNYWIDITSPSNEEMKAISKVSIILYKFEREKPY